MSILSDLGSSITGRVESAYLIIKLLYNTNLIKSSARFTFGVHIRHCRNGERNSQTLNEICISIANANEKKCRL